MDLIADGKISFVVNTPRGRLGRSDGEAIRKAASLHRVSCVTTVNAALAAVQGLAETDGDGVTVKTLQEYHGQEYHGHDHHGQEHHGQERATVPAAT